MNENHSKRTRPTRPAQSNLWDELWTGTLVGLAACLGLAWASGGEALALILAVPVGAGAGGVIGLLLWIESTGLPDEPVLPPAPSQQRAPRRRR